MALNCGGYGDEKGHRLPLGKISSFHSEKSDFHSNEILTSTLSYNTFSI